jgi:hypothetical protein
MGKGCTHLRCQLSEQSTADSAVTPCIAVGNGVSGRDVNLRASALVLLPAESQAGVAKYLLPPLRVFL